MELISTTDFLALRVTLVAAEARAIMAEIAAAEAANINAINADLLARNALLELQIEQLTCGRFGPASERSARLIDQMEWVFEELEANANEAEALAAAAAVRTTTVLAFTRQRARRELPEHLPRERVVIPAPDAYLRGGGDDLAKLGEDLTETLEVIPPQFGPVLMIPTPDFSHFDTPR